MNLRISLFLVGLAIVFASPLRGQSITSGSVRGVVLDADSLPAEGVRVALRGSEGTAERSLTTDRAGTFRFTFVEPGHQELLVEALGYRPLLVRPLEVRVGTTSFVRLSLEPAEQVVAQMDTVAAPLMGRRWTPGGVRVPEEALSSAPLLRGRLSELTRLSASLDAALGIRGLPGSSSSVFVDGVRFPTAIHPLVQAEEATGPILPVSALSGLQLLMNPTDVEWGAGPLVSMASRTGRDDGGNAVWGAWSADPLWSSETQEFEAPALSSVWGSARVHSTLGSGAAQLSVSGDGMRVQTPLPARVDSELQLPGGAQEELAPALARPAVESLAQIAGGGRLDWWFGPLQRFSLRAFAGYRERSYEGHGPPLLGYGAATPGTATDFALSAQLTDQRLDRLTLELRGGVSGSAREYLGAGTAQALVAEPGLLLGSPAGVGGEVSRLDVDFTGTAHYEWRSGTTVKGGAQLRTARHSFDHSSLSGGRHLFADLDALRRADGVRTSSTGPDVSFPLSELGAFAQFAWSPDPQLRFTLGGRIDYQAVNEDASLNADLQEATGLDNGDHPGSWILPGGGASVAWELAGPEGGVTLLGGGSLQQGEIGAASVAELLAMDGATRISRFVGSGTGWPSATDPTGAVSRPAFTLFGPDIRPPRHLQADAGLLTRLAPNTVLYTGAAYRRTDFLVRRRNLNLTVGSAIATDVNGRPLPGEIRKDGALLTADGTSHRRFPEFDDIWALDPDGWSTYRAATVGLEHRGDRLELAAAYTRSTTEDNWIGAAVGRPESTQPSPLPDAPDPWAEGVSDLDVPDRAVAYLTLRPHAVASVTAAYRYRSGHPFTPGYRRGVDANGDGSGFNDPAFVPDQASLGSLTGEWDCLREVAGSFATRNACRGPGQHELDLRLSLRLGTVLGGPVEVVVDGLNLVESTDGIRDTALLLVDADAPLSTGADGRLRTPTSVNPDFGRVVLPSTPGRILRLGLRIGR